MTVLCLVLSPDRETIITDGLATITDTGYPYLIAPLFNKYQRLSEFPEYQEVQTRTENLAKRVGIHDPLQRLNFRPLMLKNISPFDIVLPYIDQLSTW